MTEWQYTIIYILHGAAMEAFGKMPFMQSQEDEVARMRMWHVSAGLAAMCRSYNNKILKEMLKALK